MKKCLEIIDFNERMLNTKTNIIFICYVSFLCLQEPTVIIRNFKLFCRIWKFKASESDIWRSSDNWWYDLWMIPNLKIYLDDSMPFIVVSLLFSTISILLNRLIEWFIDLLTDWLNG